MRCLLKVTLLYHAMLTPGTLEPSVVDSWGTRL